MKQGKGAAMKMTLVETRMDFHDDLHTQFSAVGLALFCHFCLHKRLLVVEV